ncbi:MULTISPECIES: DNA repair protein RecN [unclassified Flavobacterium]|uniref:DNA repair protein RecN n=1 Tax=unclassified Flavobacterium TaxID=196869 RepID=UPI001292AD65|nr:MULTISPECIES: DNA repair protein RecN [unclassified Flavobacterium]MQP52545.1 DNA repair protein RecN [Flavobacterium sp. LMO9]MQP62615.1 DNA repair protein RecN [Flavobacterium sp. LMO6]
MLLSLSIKNYALIESLETDFSNQFSVITGETGAGKSILLGALGLVLGNRADLTSLKDKEQKCIIEAQFSISNYNLQSFFDENDMDYEDKTIIRREILPTGKSRAFVNDSPVNLQELQELGAMLLDIHSQHQTRELTEENYQIDILDAVANNGSIVISYKNALSDFKATQKELKQLVAEKEALVKEYEYNSYLLNELLAANLANGEQEDLEQELEQLSNVEFIKENLERISAIANEEQVGALMNLKEIKISLQKIATFSNLYSQLQERLTSSLLEIEDIISECEQSNEKILADPERLELVTTKLQSIYNLQKKHQVQTVSELLLIQDELDAKVIRVDDLDGAIYKLESELNKQQIQVDEIAKLVSENRKKTAPILIEKIRTILSQLGMVEANFQIEINHTNSYYPKGKDEVVLLFSANKGTSFGLLKKVASGGEMSRIMLAIKAILANYSKLPTIIFDEIDTGVSGEIAIKMGEIMKEMSKTMQVFAITHLPQIAAKGSSHYKVSKRNQGETTISELNLLTAEERIQQIAEMLSGKEITESALQHAKALLN